MRKHHARFGEGRLEKYQPKLATRWPPTLPLTKRMVPDEELMPEIPLTRSAFVASLSLARRPRRVLHPPQSALRSPLLNDFARIANAR